MLAVFLRFLITVITIPILAEYVPFIRVDNLANTLLVGVVLAVIYTILRPISRLLLNAVNVFVFGVVFILVDAWAIGVVISLMPTSVAFANDYVPIIVSLCINLLRFIIDIFSARK